MVVLDNLGSDKINTVRRAVEAAGAQLWFLPPYSPHMNPIEQAFSRVKHWLPQTQSRTADNLLAGLAEITERFPPIECANSLKTSATVLKERETL